MPLVPSSRVGRSFHKRNGVFDPQIRNLADYRFIEIHIQSWQGFKQRLFARNEPDQIFAQAHEKHTLPPLGNTHRLGIKQVMVHIISGIIKATIYVCHILFRAAKQQSFHVFRNNDFRLQPLCKLDEIEKQRVKNLFGLSLPELLHLSPCFFTASRHTECGTRR